VAEKLELTADEPWHHQTSHTGWSAAQSLFDRSSNVYAVPPPPPGYHSRHWPTSDCYNARETCM